MYRSFLVATILPAGAATFVGCGLNMQGANIDSVIGTKATLKLGSVSNLSKANSEFGALTALEFQAEVCLGKVEAKSSQVGDVYSIGDAVIFQCDELVSKGGAELLTQPLTVSSRDGITRPRYARLIEQVSSDLALDCDERNDLVPGTNGFYCSAALETTYTFKEAVVGAAIVSFNDPIQRRSPTLEEAQTIARDRATGGPAAGVRRFKGLCTGDFDQVCNLASPRQIKLK